MLSHRNTFTLNDRFRNILIINHNFIYQCWNKVRTGRTRLMTILQLRNNVKSKTLNNFTIIKVKRRKGKEEVLSRFPPQIIFELTWRNVVVRDSDVPFQRLNFPSKRFGPHCHQVMRRSEARNRPWQGDFLAVELQSKLWRSAPGTLHHSASS